MNPSFLAERDKKCLWHPFDVFKNSGNIAAVKSSGSKIYTEDGRALTDLVSSWWVNLHGHNHPVIVKAIREQAEELSHIIFSGFTHNPAVTLAEKLLEILPGRMDKIFLSDNGSTAVEVGLKMALQFWFNSGITKTRILAFEGGYHGDTFGAMSLAGPEPFNQPFEQHLFEVICVPFPADNNFEKILQFLGEALQKEDIAALVYEPVIQGVGGMRLFDIEEQETILKLCREKGALLIADEVMTGFGRAGKLFASEYINTTPDIICLSKGITGGFLPLGATAATEEVYEAFSGNDKRKLFLHGHSYTGNALACAAANASLSLLLTVESQMQRKAIEKQHEDFLPLLKDNVHLEWSASLGTILTMNLKPEKTGGYFDSQSEKIYRFFLERDLLVRPLGNSLYLSPPYCITEAELNLAYEAILAYLKK